MNLSEKNFKVNESITSKEVRLIDETGKQIGIKSIQEALQIARSKGLDLVEVSPFSNPPVCKILDYSKYKYELQKRLKEERKKQRLAKLKEIWLSPKITDHDLEFKINHAIEFLELKHKVKFVIFFHGREMTHQEFGFEVINKVKEKLSLIAKIDNEPTFQGNRLVAIFSPIKK